MLGEYDGDILGLNDGLRLADGLWDGEIDGLRLGDKLGLNDGDKLADGL